MQIEFQPPDGRTISGLLTSADQFEQAVRNGKNFVAAMSAHSILRVFGRFFPAAVALACSQSSQSPQPSSPVFICDPSTPDSTPDPVYVQTVSASVQEFKEAISAGDSTTALSALLPTGILQKVHSPAQELESLEINCFREGGYRRLASLPEMAKLALWLGDADKADRYAVEVLTLLSPRQRNPLDTDGKAIHDANMVLGVLALLKNDLERAKKCLIASARTEWSSFEARMAGPNLTLANELAKFGERETVTQYLETCPYFRKADRSGLTSKWIAEIHDGKVPDFGPFLCA
jgi:hypothetical protein